MRTASRHQGTAQPLRIRAEQEWADGAGNSRAEVTASRAPTRSKGARTREREHAHREHGVARGGDGTIRGQTPCDIDVAVRIIHGCHRGR